MSCPVSFLIYHSVLRGQQMEVLVGLSDLLPIMGYLGFLYSLFLSLAGPASLFLFHMILNVNVFFCDMLCGSSR